MKTIARSFACARKGFGVGALLLAACGSSDGGGALTTGGSDASFSQPASGTQCDAGAARTCACGDAGSTGNEYCYQGYWLTCSCIPAGSSVSTAGECAPGRYEGTFSGFYASGFSWGGLPIPVIALDPLGGPGLALTLSAVSRGAGEFVEYSVSDGYIKGNADGLFPIEGVITGSLNCTTKEFSGTLKGWYSLALDLGIDLNRGFFEGPVHAYYDAATKSFVQGTWNVIESTQGGALAPVTTAFQTGAFSPGMLVQNYGGNGDWSATWARSETGDGGVASAADAGRDGGP
jgi:hypothetical protein